MATYVLVHGGWSGAHGFRRVRAGLQGVGHSVFTPSLTGIGEKAHLTSPLVGLSTHVEDVVNQILYEDLQSVVLLGFSYGGCVVTGAVDHVASRVRHLVYLDAFVPENGQSIFLLTGRAKGLMELGDGWLIPPPPRQFDDPDEAAFMNARRTAHPIKCFSDEVRLSRAIEDYAFGRTYIRATADEPDAPGAAAFNAAAARARQSPSWRYREIATNHMIASNRPQELIKLLLELA